MHSEATNHPEAAIVRGLSRDRQVWGPVTGTDGVVRLQVLAAPPESGPARLPMVPLKKLLLPAADRLWTEDSDHRRPGSSARAVVGVAPCDLAGVAYLDRVFAEDPGYQARRARLFLVGRTCQPEPECFCPAAGESAATIPFDLFVYGTAVYSGSPAGDAALAAAGLPLLQRQALPADWLPRPASELPEDLAERFAGTAGQPLWEAGERCLSCGACSVVCPTCYCYDMRDEVDAEGRASRQRIWDNCFFRSHALVAGGHNFRSSRSERLRFRFEHKLLGFGELRGVVGCVGCGRCRRACPVDIDVARLARELAGEVVS